MKKFLSILMVLAMVLSLSVTAFADQETGSITITNATAGKTYKIYKIFDASINKDATGEADSVSYSIQPSSQFFDVLFGTTNAFFDYNTNTHAVTKKDQVNDAALITYLTDLIANGNYEEAKTSIVAPADADVVFTDLPYGYYVITSGLGSAVTITSNAPDASVIDKNQKPGSGFDKLMKETDENGNISWVNHNSANIGDAVTYKITFEATNYDGENQIQYYQVHDEKGNALWAEFDSFEVYVNGKLLPRGYYLDQGNNNNGNWQYLNEDSTHEDAWGAAGKPEAAKARDNAQWYLVHLNEDEFRITIPWLTNHHIVESTTGATYSLTFGEGATSKYDSPVEVKIIYTSVVEANASIGSTSRGNRFNKAYVSWTSEHETHSTSPKEVVTHVFGIGVLKDDIATRVNLAGAKFRVYNARSCRPEDAVYVIPTDVDGVYIVDSLNTPLERVSGDGAQIPRELFAAGLTEYLKDDEGNPVAQNNLVVSQVNGKLVILGLKKGTYYLVEVKAPDGYNAVPDPIEFRVDEDTAEPFFLYVADDGSVADIQTENATYKERILDVTQTVVHNSQGVVLPSTGGEGTFLLVTIGTVLAIVFAVFLITHKKMSIYTD